MGKSAKQKYQLNGFFGDSNRYYLMGVQSYDTLFPFLAKLERFFGTRVTYLDACEDALKDSNYLFARAYTRLSEPCDISFFIIENKSSTFNQQGYPILKKEKNLNFHTLSLFDEFCYLLNKQGLCLYPWEHSDCDYLFLFFAPKERNLDTFVEGLKKLPKTRIFTAENWFGPEPVPQSKTKEYKAKLERRKFFENLFCSSEIAMIEREQRDIVQRMSNVTRIPLANLLRPSFADVYDTDSIPHFTSPYVEFLRKDPSFEL